MAKALIAALPSFGRFLRNVDLVTSLRLTWAGSEDLRTDFVVCYRHLNLELSRTANIEIHGKSAINLTHHKNCGHRGDLIVAENARLSIEPGVSIYSRCDLLVAKNATLRLGRATFINTGTTIRAYQHVEIGDYVMISEGVFIRDTDNHQVAGSVLSAPVVIGNGSWIGMRATILKGVTVGEGAVVAAGAVVTRNVPPRTLVAGVPARAIREHVEYKR